MLRLNMAIPPTAGPEPLGVLGGDLAGSPTAAGSTTTSSTSRSKAMAGATPLTPEFNAGVNARLGDGVERNDVRLPRSLPVPGRAAPRQRR